MKFKIYNSKYIKMIENIQNNTFKGSYKYDDINGIKTYVIEKGEGVPIILIHGLLACVYTWRKVFYPLSEKFHVYAYDLRGCGCSEKPRYDYSINNFTNDLKNFMDYYKIDKAILIGNSLGGEIALNMVIKYPDRVSKLILIDSSGCRMNMKKSNSLVKLSRLSQMPRFLTFFLNKTIIKYISRILLVNHKIIDDEFINAYYCAFRDRCGIDGFISLTRNLSYTEFSYEKVKYIQKPTLVIWGEKDRLISVEDAYKITQDISNSKLVIFPNCGHGAQEECSERLINEITNFVLDK